MFNNSFKAPQLPADAEHNYPVQLASVGSRLMNAVVRTINGTNYLWTCHHVGLDAIGGNYDGYPAWYADRSAIQWLRLEISSGAETMSHSAHGRIYDPAYSNPYSYYMPSVAVNSGGDMLLGFSGSRASEHIGAFYAGRKSTGVTTKPVLLQAGRAYYARLRDKTPPDDDPQNPIYSVRWGDYSFTCVDPDGSTFWTVQEYADIDPEYPIESGEWEANAWGTWIMSISRQP